MSPNEPRQFQDIAHPGNAAPSPTSRPVIPQASQPDPMLGTQATVTVPPVSKTKPSEQEQLPTSHAYGSGVMAGGNLEPLDAQALLIQAGQHPPAKASVNRVRKIALIFMIVTLLILCGATYWFVSTM